MAHIIGDPIQIRDRNVITIPKDARNILNVSVGDWIGFDVFEREILCIHKIIPHRIRNKNCKIGGVDAHNKKNTTQS